MRQTCSDQFDEARRKAIEVKQRMITILANKIRGLLAERQFHLFYGAIFTLQQNYKLFAYINKMNKIREVCRILQMKAKMNKIKSDSKKFTGKLKN